MRIFRLALTTALLLGLSLPAIAAVAWTEAQERGRMVTRWTRGSDLNEVHAAARATSGPNYHVLTLCRTPGYFAFVGSDLDQRRGVSCGYDTPEAAIHMARLNCEIEGGRCDLERIGHDDGSSILGGDTTSPLPTDLPGTSGNTGNFHPPTGPVSIQ